MQLIYKKSKNEQFKDCCLLLEVGACFVKNLNDAFGVVPDCQPSRGFLISKFKVILLGVLCTLQKKIKIIYIKYKYIYIYINYNNKKNKYNIFILDKKNKIEKQQYFY